MNKVEEQILKNQKAIMEFLISPHKDFHLNLVNQNIKNDEFLNPEVEPTLAERTHDALSEDAPTDTNAKLEGSR